MPHKNARVRCQDQEWGEEIVSGLLEHLDAGAVLIITDETVKFDRTRETGYAKPEDGNVGDGGDT